MEKLTAAVLNAKFGAIIAPDADVLVPFGWTNIVSRMLERLADLPTDVRAFLIVTGILIDEDGLLQVFITALEDIMGDEAMRQVQMIVRDAREHAAWSCVRDSHEAWIVRPPKGKPRPLCPDCQREIGLSPECHVA